MSCRRRGVQEGERVEFEKLALLWPELGLLGGGISVGRRGGGGYAEVVLTLVVFADIIC
jgi:hypothetical protein